MGRTEAEQLAAWLGPKLGGDGRSNLAYLLVSVSSGSKKSKILKQIKTMRFKNVFQTTRNKKTTAWEM